MKMFSLQLIIKCPLFIFFTVFLFGQLNLCGQQITLPLEGPDDLGCDEVWIESNLELNFTNTTIADCAPDACFFAVEPGLIWLFPSRLVVDLSGLQNIIKVEVDVNDFCGVGCTKAFLEDSGNLAVASAANTMVSSIEVLSLLNPPGTLIDQLAISSCEGQILEIRIFQDVGCVTGVNTFVGTGNLWNDPSNWSLLKIPEICHDVIIPQNKNVQILNGESAICHTLDVEANATFEVPQSAEIIIAAGN